MNNKYYTKLLSTLVNKIILIEYMSGSGGCLVHRIIGSDYSNIYWDKGINNATNDSLDPLLWPDSGFHIQKPHSIPEAEQANYTCHTGSSMFYKEQEVDPTVLSLIIKANKVYKKRVDFWIFLETLTKIKSNTEINPKIPKTGINNESRDISERLLV